MRRLVGIDEAGRGALAGPVVAAAVIFPAARKHPKIKDSKQMRVKDRLHQACFIRESAHAWSIAMASVNEIDQLNIHHASLLAMKRAVELLDTLADFAVVDGKYYPKVKMPGEALIKGDSLVAEISAASILAKTARDALMIKLGCRYPGYGLGQHKGYPTKLHLARLLKIGVSPCHRRSYGPVARLLDQSVVTMPDPIR
ncbi:MAG: ribonuclease HII [Arenicellales bacterium]|nr:ribonuclease HII [Arenicellales bacterium]